MGSYVFEDAFEAENEARKRDAEYLPTPNANKSGRAKKVRVSSEVGSLEILPAIMDRIRGDD